MPPEHDAPDTIPYRVGLLETAVIRLTGEVSDIKEWRAELRGAMALIKFTLGTSILSGLIAIITLVGLVISAYANGRPV